LIVSGASRQRVRLAVAGDNSLKGEALDIMSVLRAEAARGICVVVSLHDLGLAARFRRSGDRAGGRPTIIDAAYNVGLHTVILEGVTQPVAWSRQP
jgi:hypothetical protein